jgi:hypothetical protein
MLPGSAKTYDGAVDANECADLIADLEHANRTPACAKPAR